MKKTTWLLLCAALVASAKAIAFAPYDPIFTNAFGLGTSPLGLEVKPLVGVWSNQNGPTRIKHFLGTFVGRYPAGTAVSSALEDAGLECAPAPAKLCSYTGIFMYELRQSDGPTKRTGWRIDIAVNYEHEPWDVKGYGRYIYGSPSPGGDTETFKFP